MPPYRTLQPSHLLCQNPTFTDAFLRSLGSIMLMSLEEWDNVSANVSLSKKHWKFKKTRFIIFITRDSELIIFSPWVFVVCLFVCVCLCLSRCLSGRFNYEGLVPYKLYFAGTLLGMSSCASYVSRTHDIIDDVTKSQSRSNFEIDISSSISELNRWSKVQNIGNAKGYLSGIFNFGITSGKKVCRELKMVFFKILKILKYQTQLQFDLRYEKIVQNHAQKSFSMLMTSQGGLKVVPL